MAVLKSIISVVYGFCLFTLLTKILFLIISPLLHCIESELMYKKTCNPHEVPDSLLALSMDALCVKQYKNTIEPY